MEERLKRTFSPVSIRRGCSADLLIQSSEAFFPDELVVPSEVAKDFLITDIRVGKNSQLLSTGCIPAMIFAPSKFPVKPILNDIGVGDLIKLSVTNQSLETKAFTAELSGNRMWKMSSREHEASQFIVGFGSVLVASTGLSRINVQPHCDFRLKRLIIPSTIRNNFKVKSLAIVGVDGYVWEEADVSFLGQSFAETEMCSVNFGQPVSTRHAFLSISVENMIEQSINFQAAATGELVAREKD